MAGTRFDCKEHSLFDGSGTAAGGAGDGPGVRGRRAVSVAVSADVTDLIVLQSDQSDARDDPWTA